MFVRLVSQLAVTVVCYCVSSGRLLADSLMLCVCAGCIARRRRPYSQNAT